MAKKSGNKLWAATPSVDKYDDSRYRAEDDLRTLERAREIERDKSRMKMVKTVAKEKIKSMKDIC